MVVTVREQIAERNEEALLADGFDDALIGIDMDECAVYDFAKCVSVLMKRDGMSEEAAEEFMDFNVIRGGFGDFMPVFVRRFTKYRVK